MTDLFPRDGFRQRHLGRFGRRLLSRLVGRVGAIVSKEALVLEELGLMVGDPLRKRLRDRILISRTLLLPCNVEGDLVGPPS